eukprot:TRINITY_DN58707_c0_g1_i1.p1 TRINITY_DN58707_c0_g1~~TRINITY_DN58707_c0_g1_i1.p1  ORF type:complete len:250 (+),score=29.71 TRINITY_DN58707_c0_g1_i1:146-895(+)
MGAVAACCTVRDQSPAAEPLTPHYEDDWSRGQGHPQSTLHRGPERRPYDDDRSRGGPRGHPPPQPAAVSQRAAPDRRAYTSLQAPASRFNNGSSYSPAASTSYPPSRDPPTLPPSSPRPAKVRELGISQAVCSSSAAKELYERGAMNMRAGRIEEALTDYDEAMAMAVALRDRPLQGSLRLAISRAQEAQKKPSVSAVPNCSSTKSQAQESLVQDLMRVGVAEQQARQAARRCSSVEAAIEWLEANKGL